MRAASQAWHTSTPAGPVVAGEVLESRHTPLWVAEARDAIGEDLDRRLQLHAWCAFRGMLARPSDFRLGGSAA
ncbi:hypothetical protein Aph01nite_73920 [Acrocarpospora phusangensis]|uniref:Uncharacterized protein n=1 Tax=Acrocarpospora phusangensis TaxID=1070424 RepID=A0A919QMX5_9ACTN|nr:hypothetical protein [Acrocarpospora phusangensis]GIH29082.1 hypothetical protein Aph01nite_73920 [Acrocarpospora phusangensis]